MAAVDRSAQITLRTLITARWVLLGLLVSAALAVSLSPDLIGPVLSWFPQSPDPTAFFATLGVWLVANLVTLQWVLKPGRATQGIAGLHLLIDATVLTVLLELSGGATNPFTTVYFVPITLATQVSPRWTWTLAGYCLVGFAILFVMQPLPEPDMHAGHMMGHGDHFAGHLRGMWIAFGVSGGLITYFVHRIALSLARQRKELGRLREQAIQGRHLAALGTLAAGAAHELGTPLGSIQLLVGELPHMSEEEHTEAVGTIKGEIGRCKEIVHRMASPEMSVQNLGAEGAEPWPVSVLGEQAQRVVAASDIELHLDIPAELHSRVPREPVEQILRELVANAVDACQRREDGKAAITVAASEDDDEIVVEVRDQGVGMDSEVAAHAFDPFYSTKAEGEGMGLGLYLARAQLRQLGGQLELESTADRGTTLRMLLPIQPASIASGFNSRNT
ncbi:MAG: HAMP domain-containing sensor histidine kinase [Myxococcota bacterium]